MVVIVSTMKDILEGDAIIGVNGESVSGKSINEIVALIKGEPDKEVILTIKRNENEVFDVFIVRKYIDNPTVYTEMLTESPNLDMFKLQVFHKKLILNFWKK